MWKVPPCVSITKNPKGLVIPLDIRLANDGRNLKKTTINQNFLKFSQALAEAEKNSKYEIDLRNKIKQKLEIEEEMRKEKRIKDLARLTRNEKLIGKKRERKENYEGKDKEKILKREGNKSDSDIDDRVCGIYSNKISEQNDNTRQENTLKHDKEQYKNRNKQKLNVLEKLNKGIKDELFDEKLYLRDQDKNELDNTKIAEPYDKPLFNDKIRMSDIYKSYADDESKDYDKRTRELIKKQLEKGGHLFNNAGIDGLEMLKKGPIVFEKGGNL